MQHLAGNIDLAKQIIRSAKLAIAWVPDAEPIATGYREQPGNVADINDMTTNRDIDQFASG